MSFRKLILEPWFWISTGILSLVVALLFGAAEGLEGMALGLVGASFGVTALWLLVRWMGAAATAGTSPRFGSLLTLLAFAAKIPLYVVLWRLSGAIGGSAPGCFIAGVVLVYFAVVAWAVTAEVGDKSAV